MFEASGNAAALLQGLKRVGRADLVLVGMGAQATLPIT